MSATATAALRVLSAVGLLVAGALTGVAAGAVHGRWWGLALAFVVVLVAVLAVPRGWTTRLPFAVGFVAVVARLAVPRPEGDFVVAAAPSGYALLLLALMVASLALATLPRPRRAAGERPPGVVRADT